MQLSLQFFLQMLTSTTKLTSQECDAILSLTGTREELPSHTTFVDQGSTLESVCLVVEGLCGRLEPAKEERQQITGLYVKGDIPDLYGVYIPNANESFIALCPSSILRIRHSSIRKIINEHPGIAEAITRYLLIYAATTSVWLVNLGARDAASRISHFFCETALRLRAEEGNAFSFPLRITQTQLSEIVGLSAVHVNRSLKSLRDAELVSFMSGRVHVLDWQGLVKAAGFDPAYLRHQGKQLRFAPA